MPKEPKDPKQTSQKGVNIEDLNMDELTALMKSFDMVICDCEGVLWQSYESIPDTGLGIMALKKAGKQIRFLSNNSSLSDAQFAQKFQSIGISGFSATDMLTPGKVMLHYLKKYYAGQGVYSLCTPELNQMFVTGCIKINYMEPQTDITTLDLIQKLKPESTKLRVSAVVYNLNFNLTFAQLARAQQYLIMDNCDFIVGAIDTFIPVSRNFSALCTTGIISILRESSGKEPICCGKTGTLFREEIISAYNIRDVKRVLYIGDNLFVDVAFGRNCGFQTVVASTGRSNLNEINLIPNHMKPDYFISSVADFAKIIGNNTFT